MAPSLVATLATLGAAAVALVPLHIVAMAGASLAVGAALERVRLFFGPALTLRPANPRVEVGCLPLGGHVQCAGQAPDDEALHVDEARRWRSLPRWRRALVLLSGNLALLLLSAALSGPAEALSSFVSTPSQLFSAFDRHGAFVDTLRAMREASIGPAAPMLASVAAKLAAYNLLPFAGSNGYQLARLLVPEPAGARVDMALMPLTMLAVLVVMGAWAFALATA